MDSASVYQQLLKNGDLTQIRGRKASAKPSAVPASLPKITTGVRRLDDLLGGGLPLGTATLLHGPPFTGKSTLQRRFFLEGLRAKQPSIYLLTDTSASDMSRTLHQLEPDMAALESKDSCAYIDIYTSLIGEKDKHHRARYVDDAQRWEQVLRMVERTQNEQLREHPGPSRLVIESISSLMIELGPAATFRFLRTLVGRFARRGGTSILAIDTGMHASHDVETIKHLCRGMVSLRETNDQFYLRVEGIPTEFSPGWVEYQFNDRTFEVTGSFASGRIRGGNIPAAPISFQVTQ